MRAWRGTVSALGAALVISACSGIPGFVPGEPSRVGPSFTLGPVPAFGLDGSDAGHLVFYETRDGWCTEFDGGKMCVGSGGRGAATALPEGFTDFGSSEGPDRTCIETLAGNEVVRLEVAPGDAPAVTLRPLGGSEEAPVNAFAACWGQQIPYETISVRAFDAAGKQVRGVGR